MWYHAYAATRYVVWKECYLMQRSLAERLRVLRARKGLSLLAASEELGVDRHTLRDLELGQGRTPRYPTLAKIAEGYGVPVEDLLEEPVPLAEGQEARPSHEAQAPGSAPPTPNQEERSTLRTEVETFISDAQEALDFPDLTEDIAHQISAEATDLLLKAIEVKNAASREKGYTFRELNDISFAHDQIMEFSGKALQTYLNKFGESRSGQKLESRRLRAVQESA
jgi:transcriptional regulator with XRE-family HTH domain